MLLGGVLLGGNEALVEHCLELAQDGDRVILRGRGICRRRRLRQPGDGPTDGTKPMARPITPGPPSPLSAIAIAESAIVVCV